MKQARDTDKPAIPATDDAKKTRANGKVERLQKILASAGIASRRKAEEFILQGRVQVNGQIVSELGSKADPVHDHIRVDGKLIHPAGEYRYYMLNKPKQFVTTVSDPQGRPTVMEFFSRIKLRMFPVGRLDYHSEGLLLVTNDGELANALTRAASHVPKTYLVKVSGVPSDDALNALRRGVSIPLGDPESNSGYRGREARVRTAPATVQLFRKGENPWYEVTITEGRNRQLRKMFEEVGHHVEKIRRVEYGPLVLNLPPGESRELTAQEVQALYRAAKLPSSHGEGTRISNTRSRPNLLKHVGAKPNGTAKSTAMPKVHRNGPRQKPEAAVRSGYTILVPGILRHGHVQSQQRTFRTIAAIAIVMALVLLKLPHPRSKMVLRSLASCFFQSSCSVEWTSRIHCFRLGKQANLFFLKHRTAPFQGRSLCIRKHPFDIKYAAALRCWRARNL